MPLSPEDRERFTRECMDWERMGAADGNMPRDFPAAYYTKPGRELTSIVNLTSPTEAHKKAWLWDAACALAGQGVCVDISLYGHIAVENEVAIWCLQHPEEKRDAD